MENTSEKLKILIVDDALTNRLLLCEAFEDDFEVLQAENGEVALAMLHKNPDTCVVLLDLIMPVIDGFSVLQSMLEDPALSDIPVIVVTSADEIENQVRAFDLGASDILTKPLNIQLVRHRIRAIISRRSHTITADDERAGALKQYLSDQVIDTKTGLYNRTSFCRKAREVIDNNPRTVFVIFRIDVDGFKVVNDVYGISEGDRFLFEMGRMFSNFDINNSVFGRWEADHFVGCVPIESFNSMGLATELTNPIADSKFDFDITRRMGVYVVEERSLDINLMCDRALLALKSVKGKYENHIAYYSEDMRQELIESQQIINEMNSALADGQFIIYLQPQFNYSSNKLHGAEALVRWNHPVKGIVAPAKFVPIFEKNGFITHVDQYVWEEVCKLLRRWIDSGKEVVPISVNVSRTDICSLRLVDHFSKLVARYNLPTSLLRIEITESAYMDNPSQMIETVSRLRDAGFSVEMDDFGSGYSSLNTLKDVTVDMLKLDMKFIENGKNSERGGSILSSVIRMSNWLRLSVLAEGVETKEQADYLKSIGCIYMQGYYFARPMPVKDYEKLLVSREHEHTQVSNFIDDKEGSLEFLNASTQGTLIFNSFVGGAAIIDYDGEKVEALRLNDKFFETVGTTREVFNTRCNSLIDDFDEENRKKFLDTLNETIRTGEEAYCELCTTAISDQEIWTSARVKLLATNADKYLIYLMIENITDRVVLLRNYTRLNDTITNVINGVPAGIADFEITQNSINILYYNRLLPGIYGYTREEFDSTIIPNLKLAIHPEDYVMLIRAIAEVDPHGRGINTMRFRHICKDESWKWVEMILSVSNVEGGRIYATGLIMDIDDKVAIENKLKIQEKRYERQRILMTEVYSKIPCGVMQFYYSENDKIFLLVNCNDAICEMLAFENSDELRKSVNGQKSMFVPEEERGFIKIIMDVLIGNADSKRETDITMIRKDNTTVKLHDIISKVVYNEQVFIQHIFTKC